MEAEGEDNNAMDIYASASNVITASSSDVSMYSSTQTIRGSAGDKNRTTAQSSTMEIDKRPAAQTSVMEIDSQASASKTDFRVQSLFGNDHQSRKRKGFDRIGELEAEVQAKERTMYQLKAQIAAESSKATNAEARVETLKMLVERFQNQNSSTNQSGQDQAGTQAQDSKRHEEVIAERDTAIKSLESECHELKSQIKSLTECNNKLTQANKNSETSNGRWKADCDSLKKDVEDARKVIEDEKKAFEDTKKALEDAKKVVEDEKKAIEGEKTAIQDQLTELSSKYGTLNTELSKVNEMKSSLLDDLEAMQLEMDQLSERTGLDKNKLEEANAQLANDLDLLKEDYAALELAHREAKKNSDEQGISHEDALRRKDTMLEELRTRLDDQVHSNEEGQKLKDEQIATLQHKINELASAKKSELERKEEEIIKLQSLLDDSTTANQLQVNAKVKTKQEEIEGLQAQISAIKTSHAASETTVQDLRSQLAQAAMDKTKVDGQISDLTVKCQENSTRCSELEDQLGRASAQATLILQERDQLTAEIERRKTEINNLKDEVTALNDQLQNSLSVNAELTGDNLEAIEQSKTEINCLTGEVSTLNDRLHNLLAVKEELSGEKTKLCQETSEQRQKIEGLQKRINEDRLQLEQVRAQSSKSLVDKENVIKEIKERRDELEKLVEQSRQREDELQKSVKKLKSESKQSSDERDQWKQSFNEKTNLCGDIQRKNEELQNEIKRLKAAQTVSDDHWVARPRFDVMAGLYEKLKRDHGSLETQLGETEGELSKVQEELQQSLAQKQNFDEHVRAKVQEIKKLQSDKASLESIVKGLKDKAKETVTKSAIPDQIAVLQQENLDKSLKIQKLEREMQRLRSSGAATQTPSVHGSHSASTNNTQLPTNFPPQTNTSMPTNPSTPTRFSAARPLNGDILQDLRSVGGLGRTLARAPVQAELNRVRANYPQWRLPDFSAGLDGSKNRLKPWNEPKRSNYAMEEDEERNSNYLDDEPDQDGDKEGGQPHLGAGGSGQSAPTPGQTVDKGKQKESSTPTRNPANDMDSDDEDGSDQESRPPLDNDDDEPSDISRVQKRWEKSGRSKGDKQTVKNTINALARDLLKEAFNVQNIWAIFARDGIELKKIEDFIRDPINNGPKLRNTRIDKFAADVKSMKASPWNRALAHKFAVKAREIVKSCKDGRFGKKPEKIEWDDLFRDRLYRIYKDIIDARPQPGETNDDRVLRIALNHDKRKKRSANRSVLHVKRTSRADIAAIMIGVCRERGDQSGVDFWSYGLNATEILGDNGMSDEEDDAREVEVEGVKVKQNVKIILQSYWRHPDFDDLFNIMGQAPVLEKLIFHRAGAGRIPRIRSNKLSHRLPPTDLPREFFREEFLEPLFPHELMELKLAEYSFKRVSFKGYNPNTTPDAAGSSATPNVGSSGTTTAGEEGSAMDVE